MFTPMQPIFLTGHSRPVRQVLHNFEGDLLFTCSDDQKVCIYDTYQCVRTGIIDIQSAVRSIDVTKDSKYLLATAVVDGVFVFDVKTGQKVAEVKVPGNYTHQCGLAFGDKQFFVMYNHQNRFFIRIYDLTEVLRNGTKTESEPLCEIAGNPDYDFTSAVWGPLNKTIYVSTNSGKVLILDAKSGDIKVEEHIHHAEIFRLWMSHDFTLLVSASRDGTAKLLHPDSLEQIREFYFDKPCRGVAISPLFDDQNIQKFHLICAGGQDARDVATTDESKGGFEMRLFSIIFNEQLAEIHGHFGPVHSVDFSPDGCAFASGGEDGYVHYHRFPPEYFTKKFE